MVWKFNIFTFTLWGVLLPITRCWTFPTFYCTKLHTLTFCISLNTFYIYSYLYSRHYTTPHNIKNNALSIPNLLHTLTYSSQRSPFRERTQTTRLNYLRNSRIAWITNALQFAKHQHLSNTSVQPLFFKMGSNATVHLFIQNIMEFEKRIAVQKFLN